MRNSAESRFSKMPLNPNSGAKETKVFRKGIYLEVNLKVSTLEMSVIIGRFVYNVSDPLLVFLDLSGFSIAHFVSTIILLLTEMMPKLQK